MPVLFVGHGSPMNAIEDNEFSREWRILGEEIPKPKAIVVISAHWQTEGLKVTGSLKPEQIYDFYGFPDELYQKKYPVVGDIDLANKLAEIVEARPDNSWGIDHGAWSVLCQMFPKADVPVIQLSLDVNLEPEEHWRLAKKLAILREMGVLILGSGNVVHNLSTVVWSDVGFEWAVSFDNKIKELIAAGDFEKVVNYQELENWELAIPTNEHFLPLIYILALKESEENLEFCNEKVTMGSLSMRTVLIGK